MDAIYICIYLIFQTVFSSLSLSLSLSLSHSLSLSLSRTHARTHARVNKQTNKQNMGNWKQPLMSFVHSSSLRRPLPQALDFSRGARFLAWRPRHPFLGECQRSPKYFCECRACLDYGSACRPTVKKALFCIRSVSGTYGKYQQTKH